MERIASDARVYVAGHNGLVGSAIWRRFEAEGYSNLTGWRSSEVDLRDEDACRDAIATLKPDVVIMAAARVGGILANNTYPVEFLQDNLRVQTNLLEAAHANDVERLLFLGSSCVYPKYAPQPISEDALLTGPLEQTNDAYAIAKIAGLIAVQAYRREYGRRWISAMPTNLYGPNDSFHPENSHVLPGLLRRFHEAKQNGTPEVVVWGTGSPRREFLHVDDLADACLHLIQNYDDPVHINVGTGSDVSIAELAALLRDTVGFTGDIAWDLSKPDGTPRKLLDVSRLADTGWKSSIPLTEGLASTYRWYLENLG